MSHLKKHVIIRATNSGVHFGVLESENFTPAGKVVTLSNARRLWYWSGAASISQIANEGVKNPKSCKFPKEVQSIEVVDVIETILCTDAAIENINKVPVWEM